MSCENVGYDRFVLDRPLEEALLVVLKILFRNNVGVEEVSRLGHSYCELNPRFGNGHDDTIAKVNQ